MLEHLFYSIRMYLHLVILPAEGPPSRKRASEHHREKWKIDAPAFDKYVLRCLGMRIMSVSIPRTGHPPCRGLFDCVCTK